MPSLGSPGSLDIGPETLLRWIRQAEVDAGGRPSPKVVSTAER